MRKLLLTTAAVAAICLLVVIITFPLLQVYVLYVLYEFDKIPSLLPWHWKKVPASVTYDTFKDGRDGKRYRTVKMPDGRTWMAENLNYQTGKSWYYEDSFFGITIHYKNCGRLYDWETAMNACPNGWHVPSFEEWDSLAQSVNGVKGPAPHTNMSIDYWNGTGNKLSSAIFRDGTDDFGFTALPCGNLPIDGYEERRADMFGNGGTYGYDSYWWTATEHGSKGYAYVIEINGWGEYIAPLGQKRDGNSVRCVADRP
jgi:uncharacterized protein (TIGR02145 family)